MGQGSVRQCFLRNLALFNARETVLRRPGVRGQKHAIQQALKKWMTSSRSAAKSASAGGVKFSQRKWHELRMPLCEAQQQAQRGKSTQMGEKLDRVPVELCLNAEYVSHSLTSWIIQIWQIPPSSLESIIPIPIAFPHLSYNSWNESWRPLRGGGTRFYKWSNF